MKYKLLIKTHNKTGLKYLCKTVKENHSGYKGSGKYWVQHMKKHGRDISSQLLFESDDIGEFSKYALNKSIELDVVNSNDWANLKHEDGLDGGDVYSDMNPIKLEKAKLNMSKSAKNAATNRSIEHNKGVSLGRLNMSNESKLERKRKIQETYSLGKHDELFKRYSSERQGSNNPSAQKIMIDNIKYECIKDAMFELNLTRSVITSRLNSDSKRWENWKRI
jgi:hypothetical protein